MNSLLRLIVFPNVVAQGFALAVAFLAQSKWLTLAALLVGYLVGLVLARRLWPASERPSPRQRPWNGKA